MELQIAQIREWSKSGKHVEALVVAEALAAIEPRNRDVLYLIAANQRCLHRIDDALATLQLLEQHHPHFNLLYQERGHCYVTLRDAPRAIGSFAQAVKLDPGLAASWSMLERLYRMLRGKISDGDVAALRLYVHALIDRQRYSLARQVAEDLLTHDPDNAEFLALCAAACAGLGQNDRALALYRRLLDAAPESPEIHVALGHALQVAGQGKEAIDSYRAAAAIRPSFGDAYWSLANLKTYRFSPEEMARMLVQEDAPATERVDRSHFCFALGKAYEDRDEFEKSWLFYERGNRLKRAEGAYAAESPEISVRRLIELCTAEFFAARDGAGAPCADPIFIVGLPRSGSTLVEQILASHSQVEATHELFDLPRMVTEMTGYPDRLEDWTPGDFRRLGERYIAETSVYRTGKPFFVDKMPNNFRHIGLIHLMLPKSKIIDARREPMACCFSNLKQLFAAGQEFTYSMEDLARHYRSYLELMRHWDAALPGKILRVQYEDVVQDLDANVRRILNFCGLEFEPDCVEFYKTERSTRTASSEQVRRPIFRDSLLQWRNYEQWLGPLSDGLGDARIRYRE